MIAVSTANQAYDPSAEGFWRDLGFNRCQLPCFAGIVPGETAFTEVTSLLASNIPGLRNQLMVSNSQVGFSAESRTTLYGSAAFMSGGVYYFQGHARDVRSTVNFPLYWALLRFGTPDCVGTNLRPASGLGSDFSILYLYWQEGSAYYWVGTALFQNRITFDARVYDFGISANESATPVCERSDVVTDWQGAAALWRYNQHS